MNISTAPTTNIRILTGIGLAVLFVLGTMVAALFGHKIDFDVFVAIGTFILVQEGLDVLQWGIKRKTFDPDAMREGLTNESLQAPPAPEPAPTILPLAAPVAHELQPQPRRRESERGEGL